MSTFVAATDPTTDPSDAPAADSAAPADSAGPAAAGSAPPVADLEGRDVPLGRYTVVRRYLPDRALRTIGAWCFLDRIGPHAAADHPAMWVPPHPHIGLQTVTWLVEGEVLHRDSLGSRQLVRPGELGIMTSGAGIAHSEESPTGGPMSLSGVQLWIALPDAVRQGTAGYAYHADLPVHASGGVRTTVFVGALAAPDTAPGTTPGTTPGTGRGAGSPAAVHSPLIGADLLIAPDGGARLPLDPTFEHGLLVLDGTVLVDGHEVPAGVLHHQPPGSSALDVAAPGGARAVLIGGVPFEEPLVMWWNFVGRSHEDVLAARDAWEAERVARPPAPDSPDSPDGPDPADGSRFGTVQGFPGEALPAPPLPPARLLPRDRSGRRPAG